MNTTEVVDYIKKSFELKHEGQYKPAIEMLYKALSLDGDNIEILAQLAHLYELLGNFQRALYYVEKVLESDKNHLDCMLLLKEIRIAQGEFEEAKKVAEKIYEIQPTPANMAEKIKILNKLGEFDKICELEKSEKELNDEVLHEIACACLNNGDLPKALEMLQSAHKKNDKNEKNVLLLAKLYYENGDFENSKKLFSELEKISQSAEVYNYLGLFKLNERLYEKAIAFFSKAQKKEEQNAQYTYNLASAYFLKGWFDEALKYFTRSIALEPDNVNYHYSLAYVFYQKKQYDKALMELNFIKTLDDRHEMSMVLNALIIAKQGDLLNARNQLEEIIKSNPDDDFAISALSKIYKEFSQIDLAKQMIQRALELKPDSTDYLSDLIELEIEQKNYEKALEMAEKMVSLNEKYVYARVSLAKIYLELKDFENLYDTAQKIIKIDPNCPEGYYYNAIALFEQGDTVFAIESLKKSISLDLNNAMLYVKMSEFYQDLNDIKLAYDWAKEASEIDGQSYKNKWLCAKLAACLKNENDAVKYYSQSYRMAQFDKDLVDDYSTYLRSIGKEKQAKALY